MPPLRPIVLSGMAVVAVGWLDLYSLPALLLGVTLGVFLGATLPPEWVEEPVLGPVASLRQRQPWTEPGFTRDRAYLWRVGK